MEYMTLGKSDLKVPVVGFGAWQAGKRGWGSDYSDEDIIEAIRFSIENGVNYIDTAEVYGNGYSEDVVARAIKGYDREDIILATKVAAFHYRYKDLIRAAEQSMERLNTDYIDLYQLHWPDNYISMKETVSALEKLVKDGKVRQIGLCNYPAPLIEDMYSRMSSDIPIVSNQMRYNIIEREVEDELFPYMKEKGITMIAWSPIAKGLLTGKYNEGNLPGDEVRKNDALFRKENVEKLKPVLQKVKELSDKHGKTMSQVSLNYLITKGAIVIPGAKNLSQAKDNIGASGWKLTDSEIAEIDGASRIELAYF